MEKIIFDKEKNCLTNEKTIRVIALEMETKDILDNLSAYIDGELSLETQLDFVRNACFGSLENVIKILNENYGYDFRVLDFETYNKEMKYKSDIKMYLISQIKDRFINKEDFYYIDLLVDCIEEIYDDYILGCYDNNTMSLNQSISEYLTKREQFVENVLYNKGVCE